jgi:curved DNA-binding protein
LIDPEKRKEYDYSGHLRFKHRYTSEDIFRDFDFDQLFKEFGFGFGPRSFRGLFCKRRGEFFQESLKDFSEREEVDGIYEIPLTLAEAYWGAEKEIIIDSIGEEKRLLIQIPRGTGPGTLVRVVLNESEEGEILFRVRII